MCRVLPDVPAIDRAFDYLVPPQWGSVIEPGTVVRVRLRGRRVRGWVTEIDVDPEAPIAELQTVAKVSSAGPSPELVALARWAAWRWAGPTVAFLRVATPPNVVEPRTWAQVTWPEGVEQPAADAEVEQVATEARAQARGVIQWPPASRMAELLRRLIAPRGSTIVLLPDQQRGDRLVEHLSESRYPVVDGRAERSRRDRTAAWVRARAGSCVVVGGRTAAWAPVPDLAACVVVDDADEALKDERTPAWHARDVALERARRHDARVTIVSPAPTLEALATTPRVLRPSRAREREGWGRVVTIDRREEPPSGSLFSPALADVLRQGLSAGRVVCVLNRKGRAQLLACGSCGALARCDRCGATVVEGETVQDDETTVLVCSMCNERRPRVCDSCGSTLLRRLRPGIGRLREELSGLLPRYEVSSVDGRSQDVPESPVLVGTEAVLHRIDRAAVVAFLDFDQELLAPRYRAPEQALWLIVRALRLTGGRGEGGLVAVQTRSPDDEVVEAAMRADPGTLAEAELSRRGPLGFPPFGSLAEARGPKEVVVSLGRGLAAFPRVETLGPVPVARSADTWQALIAAPTMDDLCDALAVAAPPAREQGRLRLDVDPLRV